MTFAATISFSPSTLLLSFQLLVCCFIAFLLFSFTKTRSVPQLDVIYRTVFGVCFVYHAFPQTAVPFCLH
uniref:Putative secreted peptide n=1 Tax=Anopheles braziliensis TaxID=58242 RepID=A0A2M3ZTZ8_9DIPT